MGLLLLFGGATLFFIVVFFSARLMDSVGLGRDRIAIIEIIGTIEDSRNINEELSKYKNNPGIKAILLRIDSPGGGVVPSQEIYEEVRRIREEYGKKVVVSMGSVAASGGYYIASASDRIVANPGSITGSIGVIMKFGNVEGLLEKIGVHSFSIQSGSLKDMGSPFRKMKPEERAFFQQLIDDVHDQFIQAVSEGRGIPEDEVRRLADGRIFTGQQALELHLVDDLGNLQDAIEIAAEIAGIEGEPKIVETPKRKSWLERLTNRWMGGIAGVELPTPGLSLNYLMSF